jgi:hypothetical protein
MLSLLPIPLLVVALVLDTARSRGNEFSLLLGERVGERASRWAALAFAVFVALYAVGFFSASPSGDRLYFALWGAATAFLGTYILGIVSAVGAAFMIAAIYRRDGAS